jgi:hypothetical protein
MCARVHARVTCAYTGADVVGMHQAGGLEAPSSSQAAECPQVISPAHIYILFYLYNDNTGRIRETVGPYCVGGGVPAGGKGKARSRQGGMQKRQRQGG